MSGGKPIPTRKGGVGGCHLLLKDLDEMPLSTIKETLVSINHSAIQLGRFHQSFLFTRQLSPSLPESEKQESCSTKTSIEHIIIKQVEKSQRLPKLIFDIEDVDLAVLPKYLQNIIIELIDYISDQWIRNYLGWRARSISNSTHKNLQYS
jgi:hypothetical protein